MKNIKKMLFLTAVLAVIVCAFSLVVSAGTYGDLTYEISNGEVTIIECETSATGELVIPSTIDGYPVTSIGNYAFDWCSSLTSIEIPESVTSIGNYAFAYCTGITSIEISGNVTSIGDGAFANCSGITSIKIPASVKNIGNDAFGDCSRLTSIAVDENNGYYSSDDRGALFNKDKTILIQYPNGNTAGSYKIPSSVTTIENVAFYNCSSLTSIEIPESVTSIGEYSFNTCSSLISIEIPDGVTSIGDCAFANCTALTSIKIPDSVTSMGDYYTFANCSGLKSIKIPDSVTSIGEGAFEECTGLISIEIPDSVTSIGFGAFYGCTYLTTIYYNGTKEQWNSVQIDDGNDSNDPIRNVEINGQIIFLGEEGKLANGNIAQGTCGTNLTWTLSDDGVLTISGNGEMGFWFFLYDVPWHSYRKLIHSVVIEHGITSIGTGAFADCTGLTSIEIPDSVTRIETWAFADCTGLTSIEIPERVMSIWTSAFAHCSGITSIEIPESVTSIGTCAFADCTGLTSVEIPESVTSITDDVFKNCPNLTIYGYAGSTAESHAISNGIPFSIVKVGKYGDLKYEVSAGKVTITGCERTGTGELVIPSTIDGYPVTSIGEDAFRCCSITSIEIPDSVTSIGKCAFLECYNLKSIEIPDSVTKIGSFAFQGCGITSIEIPDSVTNLGSCAFNRSSITSIKLPEGVTSIEGLAFEFCTRLESIEIPNSVTSIGDWAFSDCYSLTRIEIPNSVTSIGNGAFAGCESLTIYGYEGSYAQKYAKEKDIPFKKLPQVTVNGKPVAFPDQNPVIEDGRTLVPARGVFEALGAEVSWVDSTKTAIVKTNEKEIAVQIGRNYLVVNGKTIEIDVPAKIINGRTMIPLRAVAEALDCEVGWDAATYTAAIKSK